MKSNDQKELQAKWEASIVELEKQFGKNYNKKEFTFNQTEFRQLVKAYTIQTIAEQLILDKLNTDVLPRVGIEPNSKIQIHYDLQVGRFVVWLPKEEKEVKPE